MSKNIGNSLLALAINADLAKGNVSIRSVVGEGDCAGATVCIATRSFCSCDARGVLDCEIAVGILCAGEVTVFVGEYDLVTVIAADCEVVSLACNEVVGACAADD